MASSNPPFLGDRQVHASAGGGGKVTTSVGRGSTAASALVMQPDGKLVAAGTGEIGSGLNIKSAYIALVRYNANGSLDTSFGKGGKVTTAIGRLAFASALVRQPDGKLVVAGSSGSNGQFALVRYKANGSLDTSFGQGGKVTTAFGQGVTVDGLSSRLVRKADGKLVIADSGSKGASAYLALISYNPNGRLDASFGRGGKVATPLGQSNYSYATSALLLEPDGKLVVSAGSYSGGSSGSFVLVRYNRNGSVDRSFGRGGRVTGRGTGDNDISEGLVRLPGGKLVAAGAGSSSALALVRYKSNGSVDRSFGRRGKVTSAISPGSITFDGALILTPDGKLVAAGGADLGQAGPTGFFVVRYTQNGSLDKSFGRRGKATTVFVVRDSHDIAQALLRQPDGKLVAAGSSAGGSGFNFALARYNPDGRLDKSFGHGP